MSVKNLIKKANSHPPIPTVIGIFVTCVSIFISILKIDFVLAVLVATSISIVVLLIWVYVLYSKLNSIKGRLQNTQEQSTRYFQELIDKDLSIEEEYQRELSAFLEDDESVIDHSFRVHQRKEIFDISNTDGLFTVNIDGENVTENPVSSFNCKLTSKWTPFVELINFFAYQDNTEIPWEVVEERLHSWIFKVSFKLPVQPNENISFKYGCEFPNSFVQPDDFVFTPAYIHKHGIEYLEVDILFDEEPLSIKVLQSKTVDPERLQLQPAAGELTKQETQSGRWKINFTEDNPEGLYIIRFTRQGIEEMV